MGLFDRFREGLGVQRPHIESAAGSADEQAIARYRYLLRTAPPETIERTHAEAFAQLTPEQRRVILAELGKEIPEAERVAVERAGDSPTQLARAATRAEIRQPGLLERVFRGLSPGAMGAAPGMGGLFAGSFLSSMAGTVLGSMIAQHFFSTNAEAASLFGGEHAGASAGHHDQRLTDDGYTSASDADANTDDIDIGADFGGFDDGGTFDV